MLLEFGRSEGFPFVSAARFFERGLHSIYAICVPVLISHRHLGSSLLRHIRFFRDMAESSQDLLRSAWLEGKDGGLPGREQAKAWALREMWRDAGKADHGTGLAVNIVTQFSCEQEALGPSRVLNTASRRTCAHADTNQKKTRKTHSVQTNMNTSSHKPKHVQGPAPNTKTNMKTCPLTRERCTLPALPRHENIYRW